MINVQAKEKILEEFEEKWFIERMAKAFLHIDDINELVDQIEEQTRRETIEEIKREINKKMLVMPRPSIEQWNENLTEGTTYIRGVDLVPLFNKLTSQKAPVKAQIEEKQSTGKDKI